MNRSPNKKSTFTLRSNILYLFIFCLAISCGKQSIPKEKTDKETAEISPVLSEIELLKKSQDHENPRMRYKVLSSEYRDKTEVWSTIDKLIDGFRELDYQNLYDLIYENDILTIQNHIANGRLTYEQLTKWYLYRILKYESDPKTTLHAIISIMPDVIKKARYCDQFKEPGHHPISGMPILLKDNINTMRQPTTAGAIALAENKTYDSKIVKNLNEKGAIILGKVNLSEWAYYFCDGCPLGYSAIGGQSLNPYGRAIFETGGSSAGSGTSMAANYATAAVGTETAGSILSPSSQNSIVGLKPTIGTLSRTGIVPISSTLDTPGPMTRSVIDNAILYSAMYGQDHEDITTKDVIRKDNFILESQSIDINSLTLAANKNYIENDELYRATVAKLRSKGVKIIEFTPSEVKLDGFVSILDYDMQRDLPEYLSRYGAPTLPVSSVASVIDYNNQDSTLRAPYGQGRFIASRDDTTSDQEMEKIKTELEKDTRAMFDKQFDGQAVDAILSINNYDAAHAAIAKYPCLAMPMGYSEAGEPKAMTFIGQRFQEGKLLSIGTWFEANIFKRIPPKGY